MHKKLFFAQTLGFGFFWGGGGKNRGLVCQVKEHATRKIIKTIAKAVGSDLLNKI